MLAELFVDYLLLSIPLSLIIVLLILGSGFLHKRYEVKWSYWIWMIIAVRLLLPFNFSFEERLISIPMPESFGIESETAPVEPIHIEPAPVVALAPAAPTQVTEPVGQVVEQTANQTISWSWMDVLVWIWSAGVITLLLYHFIGYYMFKRQALRWSWPVRSGNMNAIMKLTMDEMKVKRAISIRISEKVPNPMLVGFTKPVLFLPDRNYTDEELEFILKHELVHLKRGDILYKLLLVLVKAIHWYNPFVWMMVREAYREIEISCDAKVVQMQNLTYRKKYCETILTVMEDGAARGFGLTTSFASSKRDMKQRFMNVLTTKQRRKGVVPFLTSIVLIGTITLLSACMSLTAQGSTPIYNEAINQTEAGNNDNGFLNENDTALEDNLSNPELDDEDANSNETENDDLQQIPLTLDDMKVGDIQIGDTSEMLIEKLGEPTQRTTVHGIGDPEWIYKEQGLQVSLEPIWAIRVVRPFSGSTPRGIKIGSTEDEVKTAYPDFFVSNNLIVQNSIDNVYQIVFDMENGIVKAIALNKDLVLSKK